ncbi:MAG: hypothetical protein Q8O40_13305 [Chloroflexota bacterium]|nr:hypothetical protein [Chloroflexota bacterium]
MDTTAQKANGRAPELIFRRAADISMRMSLTEFKGEWYVDFRTWWQPPGSQEFRRPRRALASRSSPWIK